ncbi:hypothetical protein ACFV3R_06010 [Streptomyces sp. NPDC059740]|uniref:hypothetical protein n=1 Tax=Streptomyces sp. NPDC059740 TaxID=3346926 RepID=UPI003653FA04
MHPPPPEYEDQLTRVLAGLLMEDRLARVSPGSRMRRRGGPPLLEIVEPRPAAAAALLGRLRHRYADNGALPVNDLAVPTGEPQASGRAVTDCLWYLSTRAGGLGGELAHRPPLAFPRLSTGLLVQRWAATRRNTAPTDLDLDEQLRLLLRELRREREDRQPPGPVEGLDRVEKAVAGLGTPGAVTSFGLALLRLLLLRGRAYRTSLRWWGRTLQVPARSLLPRREAVVAELFNVHRNHCDKRGRTAPALLTLAFLADIDAHYHCYRRLNRDRPPLILLPHAEAPAGRRLLAALVQAYDAEPTSRRRPTRPVVLAVSTTHRPLPGAADGVSAPERHVEDLAGHLGEWWPAAGRTPQERWLLTLTSRTGRNGGRPC